MTREQEQAIAVQDGGHKVLAGEMDAAEYFDTYVDQSLFRGERDYCARVKEYVRLAEG